jgi:hypothetical protein
MANTGRTGFMEIVNSNIYIPFSTASNYDMVLRTDQIQQDMFLGNGSNSSNLPSIIFSSNNFGIGNGMITPGISNRIWDFSGTISDTSLKPGPVGQNFISGSNITVSPLSPFSNINNEGSIYLPGITGNYLTLPQPTTTALTDMTIEAWVYQTTNPPIVSLTLPYLIGNMNFTIGGPGSAYWSFGINPNNQIAFYGGTGVQVNITGSNITNNTWNHIAICYSNAGKSAQLFLNGNVQTLIVSGGSGNSTTTGVFPYGLSNYNTLPLMIGQLYNVSLNAYVANLRVVNNVLYTSSFTPSTYPLQVWGSNNTQLLLRAPLYNPIEHINSIHTYDSLRAHCLPSDAMIYADCYGTNLPNLSGTAAPLFDSNITKSIVFNRTNSEYISFAPQTINIATKGFTVISKIMFTSNIANWERIIDFGNGAGNNNILFARPSTFNMLAFNFSCNNCTTTQFYSSNVLFQNIINVCVARYDPYDSGGTSTIWLNGSNIASSNQMSTSAVNSIQLGDDRTANNMYVGKSEWADAYLNANIYNLAVYNRALTDKEIIDASMALNSPPNLPNQSTVEIGSASGKPALTVKNDGTLQIAGPINATNNQSYYPMDYGACNLCISGGIIGNVPSVTMSPFNTTSEGSLYLSTSNYITIPNTVFSTNWWLNGGFTCEAWINYPTFSNVAYPTLTNIPLSMGNFSTIGQDSWSFGATQSSNLGFFYWNGVFNYITGSNLMQANTWYHIAVTCDNTNIRIFQNGVLQNSATLSGTPLFISSNFTIGGNYSAFSGIYNMYVTNPRLVYGTALYTANFTPPTGPLGPASSGTTALLLRVPQNPGRVLIPKIGGTTQVQQYPPASMNNYLTNIKNTSYGTGYYIASDSGDGGGGNRQAWCAFTLQNIQSIGTWWSSYGNYNTTTGIFAGTTSTNDIYGNSYPGEWLQIQLPVAINISAFSILLSTNVARSPSIFYLLGSKDGMNWKCIFSRSNQTSWTQNAYNTFSIQNISESYNYYRLVAGAIQVTNDSFFSVAQLLLYGTQESINITPDGQVGIGITQPIQSLEVTNNAIINGNISAGNLGMFRNRVINGDMRFNQRGVTSSTIGTGTTTSYLHDRFGTEYSITTGGLTLSNIPLSVSDNPYQYGFKNSFRTIASTACSSYGYILPKTTIEGYNIVDFNWGTSFASPITVSFWLRTSMASGNTVTLNIRNDGLTYSYNTNINVSGSNIWQYVNTTVSPPPNGSTWNSANSRGIYLSIGGYQGTALQSSSNVWVNANNLGTTTTTNVWATLNNFIEFTGLQLERGTIATPFDFRPYQIELQLCQRYSVVFNNAGGYFGTVYGNSLSGNANTKSVLIINLPQCMRTIPSFINNNASIAYDMTGYSAATLAGLSSISGNGYSPYIAVIYSTTSLTQGYCAAGSFSSGSIEFIAEM